MIVWSDNQIPKFSEGYGYTPDCLYQFIGSSGLPIRRSKPTMPSEIGRIQAGINLGYFEKKEHVNEIVINYSVPDTFAKSLKYSVGFTFWETNRLPTDWVRDCNNMDEIWTCSKAMQEVFINSGITKPVHEFKLGVDPKIYFPKKQSINGTFKFLSMGSPSTRKNSQIAVDAFLKVFGQDDGCELIYKSNGPQDARIYINGSMYPLEHPRIKVINHEVTVEELGEIYDSANCLLYPTSGEGWGLIPFQAIAKGIPTICTNALAATEFANMSVPLDFKWGTKNMSGIYENAGEWAEPNFDDLCDKMLYVVNNYAEVCDETYRGAEFINQNMTWEHVSQKYIARLKDIVNNV